MKKRSSAPVKALTHKKALKRPTPNRAVAKPVLKKNSLKKPTSASKPKAQPPKPKLQNTKTKPSQSNLSKKKATLKKPLSRSKPKGKPSIGKVLRPVVKKAAILQKKKLVLKKEAPKKAAPTLNKAPMPASKQASTQQPITKTAGKKSNSTSAQGLAPAPVLKEETKNLVLNARKRQGTPTIFKTRHRKNTPVLFTLEDAWTVIKNKSTLTHKVTKSPQTAQKPALSSASLSPVAEKKGPAQFFQAASLADILGFNPNSSKAQTAFEKEAAKIPAKYKPYYKLLVDLRSHLQQEINLHAQDALKRSGKDETSDNSSYSQHMADAGTDTFDRDFALSILSNEQDALFEIDEAIQRMVQGTYGVCEVTGKPIPKERLMAVPFTRCSIEGQKELEKNKHRGQRTNSVGVFSEVFDDEHGFSDEESSET